MKSRVIARWAVSALVLLWRCVPVLAAEPERLGVSVEARLQSGFVWAAAAPPGKQAYVAFRRNFTLVDVPREAWLHLFADARFILWVNGQYVLRGPCRFDTHRPEYDTVEVQRYLRPGANVVAVLVHHYAHGGNSKIMEHVPGLTARLEVSGASIVTDSSWRCSARTRYLPSPRAWGSIPDVLDGRVEADDWTTLDCDDSTWEHATPVDGAKWAALQPRAIPLLVEAEVTGLRLLPSGQDLAAALPLELANGQEAIIDLGRMAMAYAAVDLEADKGSVLKIQYALRYRNGHTGEGYGTGTVYTARAGRQSFITGDEWGCHYVTVQCASGRIKLHGLKLVDRRYPFVRLGSFFSNDELLNKLWSMAVQTIEVSCDDGYGADARERNEWLQDPAQPNYITTRVALAGRNPGDKLVYSDPRLLRNLLRHIALSQTADGRLKGHACSDRWDCHGYIEDYSCQWVESLRLYFDATGEKAFVREMWPALVKQMQWFLDRRTTRGLVLARQYTSFDDPLAYITCEGAALNAFIYQALEDAAYLGQAVGEQTQARAYEVAAAELKAAFNTHFWNAAEETYDSGYVQGKRLGPSAHAALLALDRGVTPDERRASVRKWFLTHYKRPGGFHCASNPDSEKMIANRAGINMPVTYYWVFQELYRMDSPSGDMEALHEMRRRWARMVNESADCGTLWETFGGPESCHNYGSVPAYFLSSFVLGVRLEGPVWNKRLLIGPRLGDLTQAEGVIVTEFGPVPVSWKRVGETLDFHFEVPTGVTATLSLPDADPATLVLDGKQARAEVRGRSACVTVGAGEHAGQIGVHAPPPRASIEDVLEQRVSPADSPVTIIARTSDTAPAALEQDVLKESLIGPGSGATLAEGQVAHDGGGTSADVLRDGTTHNGAGGAETLNDGKTFRGYAAGSILSFKLDTVKSRSGYEVRQILSFAGHADQRASQSYTVLIATSAEPAKFVKLASASVDCAGGASELRWSAKDGGSLASHVVALRLEFANGPLGFNVYREFCVAGSASK